MMRPLDLMPPLRHPLKFQAYQRVKEMITSHRLPPGQPITEMDLSKSLGMGRTPIREALNLLSKDGVIQLVPNKGAILKPVSYEDLIHIYQIRELLDPLAARQAIGRIDLTELKEIEERSVSARDADEESGQRFSRELHSLIYRSCLNPFLVEIFDGLDIRMQVCLHSLWKLWARANNYKLIKRRNQEHLAIIRALRKMDADHVAEISRNHIARALEDILHLMAAERSLPSSSLPSAKPQRPPNPGLRQGAPFRRNR
jgi:DNA-binding GntR family transcriptional regulator